MSAVFGRIAFGGGGGGPTQIYGDLGDADQSLAQGPAVDLNAVTDRLGARCGPYLGVEAEVSQGVGGQTKRFVGDSVHTPLTMRRPPISSALCLMSPQLDLIGRVGYGG